mgnify:FL=1
MGLVAILVPSQNELLPACCGLCCFGEFMSGGSSLNDTDFSKETDLSKKYTQTFMLDKQYREQQIKFGTKQRTEERVIQP